ncbi:MAG: phytanoyl-CoA dioxygenase family protein [candidate division Zixibacteria bacterium]|nr:phytanoyl-CoA dioxygenase family protein [candidate division Zixibacteria bacterium]
MASSPYRALTRTQAAHFLERGFVVLNECFPREIADEWRAFAFKRLGYDPADPQTWIEERVHLPRMQSVLIRDFAPKAWGGICDLIGGEDRAATPDATWGDSFIINFKIGAGKPWIPPGPTLQGWHKDGDFFRHFLNSPEQGLLVIVVWSDIEPISGGTFVACDSVGHIARLLAAHPEGMLPTGEFGATAQQCTDFAEITGRVGDVVLLHPFMVHSHSYNPSGRPRFITIPPVALNAPMRFNRRRFEDHSLVEQAVLRGLGVKRHRFVQTAPAERLHPEREHIQAKMLEEQKKRLERV